MAGERSVLIRFIGDSKSLEGAARSADKAVGDVGLNLGKIAESAAFAKVTKELIDFGRDSVAAAIDDKKAQEQLALALRNTVGASDELIASVEQSISKLQNQTGTLDDELRPAYATLVRATKDTTEATNLLSLANDVAAGKGKDLATVSDALAKASQGNTKGIRDLGVELKNADGSAKSFEQISRELVQLYGGAAKTAFDADPAKQLQVQMENLKETVGNALLPVIKELAGVAGDLLGWFNNLGSGTQQLIVWIGLAGGAAFAAVKSFLAAKEALESMGLAAEATQPWLLGIGIAVAGVVAAVAIFSDEESAATKQAHSFNDAIHAGSGELDLHTIAIDDATAAAKRYGEVADAEINKKISDAILPHEKLVDALNRMGISIDTVIAASHGDVEAQDAVIAARQKLVDQGEVFVNLQGKTKDAQALLTAELKHWVETGNASNVILSRSSAGMVDLNRAIAENSSAYAQNIELTTKQAMAGDANAAMYWKASGNLEGLTAEQQKAVQATLDKADADLAAAGAADRAAQADKDHEQALKDEKEAAEKAEQAIRDLHDAQLASIDSAFAARDASDRFTTSMEELAAATDDPKTGVDEYRQAQDKATQAALAAAVAQRDNAAAMREAAGAPMTAAESNQVLIDSLYNIAASLDNSSPVKAALISYIGLLQSTPGNVTTKVTADTSDAAERIGFVRDKVDELDGTETTTDSKAKTETAQKAIEDLTLAVDNVPKNITISVSINGLVSSMSDLDRLITKLHQVRDAANEADRAVARVAG